MVPFLVDRWPLKQAKKMSDIFFPQCCHSYTLYMNGFWFSLWLKTFDGVCVLISINKINVLTVNCVVLCEPKFLHALFSHFSFQIENFNSSFFSILNLEFKFSTTTSTSTTTKVSRLINHFFFLKTMMINEWHRMMNFAPLLTINYIS